MIQQPDLEIADDQSLDPSLKSRARVSCQQPVKPSILPFFISEPIQQLDDVGCVGDPCQAFRSGRYASIVSAWVTIKRSLPFASSRLTRVNGSRWPALRERSCGLLLPSPSFCPSPAEQPQHPVGFSPLRMAQNDRLQFIRCRICLFSSATTMRGLYQQPPPAQD